MPGISRQQSFRNRRAASTIQRSYRRKYRPTGNAMFKRKPRFAPVRQELKTANYIEDAEVITSTPLVYNKMLAFHNISQGLGDVQNRVGNRITGKYISLKMLIDNQNNEKAAIMRYVIWSPRSTTDTLSIDWGTMVNTKQFRVLKQGYVSLPADHARVVSHNFNLHNRTINYNSNATTSPTNSERIYLSLVCCTGQTVRYSHQCRCWYGDA